MRSIETPYGQLYDISQTDIARFCGPRLLVSPEGKEFLGDPTSPEFIDVVGESAWNHMLGSKFLIKSSFRAFFNCSPSFGAAHENGRLAKERISCRCVGRSAYPIS